jgi:DNA transformation protein
MFEGYGIFHEGAMFALIAYSRLYFKVNDSNRQQYEQTQCEQFQNMPYYEVPASILDDMFSLHSWAQDSITIAHATPSKKRRKS